MARPQGSPVARPLHRLGRLALVVCLVGSLLGMGPAGAVQNGQLLSSDEAPDWAVAIRFGRDDGSAGLCSGSLIAPDAVLTAAHCLFEADGQRSPIAEMTAIVGRADLRDTADGVERPVVAALPHPDYAWSDTVVVHDVAVLRIEPVPAGYEVLPIARTAPNALLDPVVFGYGNTDRGDPAIGLPPTRSHGLRRLADHAYFARICVEGPYPPPWSSCLERLDPKVNVLMGDSGAPWVIEEDGAWLQYLLHNGGLLEEGFGIASTTGGHHDWIREVADLYDPPTGTVVGDTSTSGGGVWLVAPDGKRHRIEDLAVLDCLIDADAPLAEAPTQRIQQIPADLTTPASCGSSAACDPADTPPTGVTAGPINPGFETGDLSGWYRQHSTEPVCAIGPDGYAEPFDGAWMARLGRAPTSADDLQPVGPTDLAQRFVVDRPTLTLAYDLFTHDAGYDRFGYEVTVEDDAGRVIDSLERQAWGRGDGLKHTGWQTIELDLADQVGREVTIRFTVEGTQDQRYPTWVYLDSAPSPAAAAPGPGPAPEAPEAPEGPEEAMATSMARNSGLPNTSSEPTTQAAMIDTH
jgi:hypothetical protein